jgi:hypothetical protein
MVTPYVSYPLIIDPDVNVEPHTPLAAAVLVPPPAS